MEKDFIYWRHLTPPGIRVEEISGAEHRSGSLWLQMALQVYGENGRDRFRRIGHYDSGAPFCEGEQTRISVTHTRGLLVVASLPRTPEADLSVFSPRAAMGVDAEAEDRRQVLSVRTKFLSEEELASIAPDDVLANIIAWTAKEACYKAMLLPGLDFARDIRITRMPELGPPVLAREFAAPQPGAAVVTRDGAKIEVELYCYRSEGCVVTLAYSPKCAKYKKG